MEDREFGDLEEDIENTLDRTEETPKQESLIVEHGNSPESSKEINFAYKLGLAPPPPKS